MAIDFNGSTLFISARSPFARRVRLAFLEHGVRFEEKVFNVFEPTPELFAANPLGRVPALRLASGEGLIDSHLILGALYESLGPSSPLAPRTEAERLLCYRWSALAVGLSEKIVELYLESLRPEPSRDLGLADEFREVARRVLGELEGVLAEGRESLLGEQRLTQADLDLGAALAYLSFRYSQQWKAQYPAAARYFDALDARPAFQATRPPA